MKHALLMQYEDLLKEESEIRDKIDKIDEQINSLCISIQKIENGEMVQDKVYGGFGGTQGFVIRGIPLSEHRDKKMELAKKQNLLEQQKKALSKLELEDARLVLEIENFICGINDAHIRRILRFRVFDRLSWNEIAKKMGGGNTSEGVRQVFCRFFKEK